MHNVWTVDMVCITDNNAFMLRKIIRICFRRKISLKTLYPFYLYTGEWDNWLSVGAKLLAGQSTNPASIPSRGKRLFSCLKREGRFWGPSSLIFNRSRWLFPYSRQPKREAGHSPPSSGAQHKALALTFLIATPHAGVSYALTLPSNRH
jgi:hypothetical protein